MEIRGTAVLVTGAASGIGRATALAFARNGARTLMLADVNAAGLAETAALVRAERAEAHADRIDLADLAAVQNWLETCEARGGYAVLHNNAGVVAGAPMFPEAPLDRLSWIVDVNLTSMVVATQIAVQAMARRGGGVIVNTVSTVALGRGFHDILYATTKAGAMMFTQACAPLKRSHGVRVAGVLPGLTETPIFSTTGGDGYAPWMREILASNLACQPSDIADAVVDLVKDDSLPGGDWVAVRNLEGRIVRQWGHDEPRPG